MHCYCKRYFLLYKRIKETELLGSRTCPAAERDIPSVEQQTFPNYWQDFKRPSEARVDELLANRCDGYTDDDDTVDVPQKKVTSNHVQMEFDFQKERE